MRTIENICLKGKKSIIGQALDISYKMTAELYAYIPLMMMMMMMTIVIVAND